MIKSITVTNNLGERAKIVLTESNPEHGMLIKSITGLGPAKANVNAVDLSMYDGSVYNSARLENRNIVIQMIFSDAPRIEDARQNTYKYFPIKKDVTIVIETDNRKVQTTGYVESNEPDIFSAEESNQISIICTDPYFYSADGSTTTMFYGVEPLFEFPFENESLTEGLLEFGSIENKNERLIRYDGDSEVGIVITIHALGEARNIVIYNTGTREIMQINTDKIVDIVGTELKAGDDIIISTLRGKKQIMLLRRGQYTNILNCLQKGCDWFTLVKGDNIFAYTAETGSENLEFKIENDVLYEGV